MKNDLLIRNKYSWLKHIDFILLDLICLICAGVITYFVYFWGRVEGVSESWREILAFSCLVDLALTLYSGIYSGVLKTPGYMITINSIKQTIYIFLTNVALFYAFKIGSDFSRVTIFVSLIIYCVISSFFKTVLRTYLTKSTKRKKELERDIVIVADRALDEEFISGVCVGDGWNYAVKAVYTLGDFDNSGFEGVHAISGVDELVEYLEKEGVRDIFVSCHSNVKEQLPIKQILDNGVAIHYDMDEFIGLESERQSMTRVGNYKSFSVQRHSFTVQQIAYLYFKRAVDIVIGLLGCAIVVVMTVLVKLVYLICGDTKPIIYSQKRVGKNGKLIRIYKYRTMVPNADAMLEELLKDPVLKEEWDKNQKFNNDPRITPVGRILRKTSIDELPQFLNVLNGTMSLIGPRPLVPGELEAHGGLHMYNKLKPGISGWWACNGRSNIEYRERLELEYYYINNVSLELDLTCVLRTCKAILVGKGVK